jgi:hypothetical protein
MFAWPQPGWHDGREMRLIQQNSNSERILMCSSANFNVDPV